MPVHVKRNHISMLSHMPDFPPEDKMGFSVPVSPSHSLQLLNRGLVEEPPKVTNLNLLRPE